MDYIVKILTLGDTSVGKTSIILRYTKVQFPKKALSTIGVDFRSRIVKIENNKKAKVLLWDTAGQERFRNVASNYYNGTDCVFLVFDITKIDTLSILSFWIEQLKEKKKIEDICMILVGNKSDMKGQRQVNQQDIDSFLLQYPQMKYYEVSALNNEGIDDLFDYAVKEVIKMIKKKESEASSYRPTVLTLDEPLPQNRGFKCC